MSSTRGPAKGYAMRIGISSRTYMIVRTRMFTLTREDFGIVEKYARSLKSIRTPRTGNATVYAEMIIVSPDRRLPISLALLAVRRNRQM